MTDTDLAQRITELIDTSAPALSADQITTRARTAVPVVPGVPPRRSRLSPALVLAYCGMAVLLTVAIVVGISAGRGSGRSKSPGATTQVSPANSGSVPGASIDGAHFADVAATPLNWTPITYGNVQISVPSGWIVYTGGGCTGDAGVVLAVPANQSGCTNAPDEAEIGDFVPPAAPDPYSLKSNGTVNGIPVATRPGSGGSSEELAESMFVEARGSLAAEILGTLTYAPDYAILLSSGTTSAPASWQTVTFGGLTFRAPSAWSSEHDSGWGGCPYGGPQSNVIRLSTAQTSAYPSCPAVLSEASSWAPTQGLVVGAGPALFGSPASVPDTSGDQCLYRNGLRICIEALPLDGGLNPNIHLNMLTALVFRPGNSYPDEIQIGLGGSGQVADAIFDSMRPASS